jgi:probable addiction module antidote protein
MTFEEFSPAADMANNPQRVALALSEAFLDGDKEAFQEILEGYLKAREITKTAKKVKLSRAVIYEAMDKTKNPSLESLCKIMKAFKDAEMKNAA